MISVASPVLKMLLVLVNEMSSEHICAEEKRSMSYVRRPKGCRGEGNSLGWYHKKICWPRAAIGGQRSPEEENYTVP